MPKQLNVVKAVLLGIVLLVVLMSWFNVLDNRSDTYVDEALVEATVAFGIARGMNAVISTFQSTTLEFSMVAGVSVSIGEVLDPLNDLIEDYSSLMKLSIVSLVLQKLLIEISANAGFKIAITLSAIALAVSVLFKDRALVNLLFKTFIFMCFIRFSLVFVIFMNGVVDRIFIQQKINTDLTTIEQTTSDLREISGDENTKNLEIQAAFLKEAEQLQKQKTRLETERSANAKKIADIENQIAALRAEKSEITGQIDVVDRLNVFAGNDATREIDEKINAKLQEFGRYQTIGEKINDDIQQLDKRLDDIEDELDGTTSFSENLDHVRKQIGSYLNTLKLSSIKNSLEQATANIMNLMALFLFKTLILPLLFLFLLVKGSSLIWGIDIKQRLGNII